ncbi:MAG: response regulator [Caldithrix sp.]|nr:response regulator [Caldithrix sp.]
MDKEATILYIDDDEQSCRLTTIYLSNAGFDVYIANDTTTARQCLKKQNIDCIISDVGLPVEDGLKFYQWLQQQPAYKIIPFLFVSAHAVGFDHILTEHRDIFYEKPIFFPALIDHVKRLLVKKL